MPTETGFNTDWLNERFRFDNTARSTIVENELFSHLSNKNKLKIVDIGSGSGSSCVYLMKKLPQDQDWTFVELNPNLAKASLIRLERIALDNNWEAHRSQNTLIIQTPDKNINIKVIHASFLELDSFLDLSAVDLVTAAAVFDLLSVKMLHDFLGKLLTHKVALLATINYAGMAFQPAEVADIYFAHLYGQHMLRPRDFGQSTGPNCSRLMMDFHQKKGINAICEPSNWLVRPTDKKMHRFLLTYFNEAIPAVLTTQKEHTEFKIWMDRKIELLEMGQLQTEVFHFDIFIGQ